MTTTPTTDDLGPWELEHTLHYLTQIETRPGAADEHGNRWADHQFTGLTHAVCNCGYTTGWVPSDSVLAPADLIAAHSQPAPVPPDAG